MTEPSDGCALEATVESDRFDQISITLHWLTALLIIVMFTTAWSRKAVDHDTRLASALMTAHRTTGVVTWFVGWMRLVWRYNFAYLPPFPESMPKLQQWVAKANEYGLYALLLVQPLSVSAMSCFAAALFHCSFGKCRLFSRRIRAFAACSWRLTSWVARRSSLSSVCTPAPRSSTACFCAMVCCDGCYRGPQQAHRRGQMNSS